MDAAVELKLHSDWTEGERASLSDLSLAVYPPDDFARWPGRDFQWTEPQFGIRVEGVDGTLLSYTGVVLRQAQHDGRSVQIGGVGGVKTHPAFRRRGYAAMGLNRAAQFFQQQTAVEFALLVCEPTLLAFYGRLGWHEFGGRVLTQQREGSVEFTFNRVMVLDVGTTAPSTGTLDLKGPPW